MVVRSALSPTDKYRVKHVLFPPFIYCCAIFFPHFFSLRLECSSLLSFPLAAVENAEPNKKSAEENYALCNARTVIKMLRNHGRCDNCVRLHLNTLSLSSSSYNDNHRQMVSSSNFAFSPHKDNAISPSK